VIKVPSTDEIVMNITANFSGLSIGALDNWWWELAFPAMNISMRDWNMSLFDWDWWMWLSVKNLEIPTMIDIALPEVEIVEGEGEIVEGEGETFLPEAETTIGNTTENFNATETEFETGTT